ncbi:MAG: GNAT family N-acetyltransferase [Magnetococcus sp. YQC-9]
MSISAPVPLDARHELDGFGCGVPSLDTWLQKRARVNQLSGASRTFVACEGVRVVGYYALASGAITLAQAAGRFRRNMPDPIPIALLTRLAVASSHQGRGLGRALFQNCAMRVVQAADLLGMRGLVVHALSQEAQVFYQALGLAPSPHNPMTLMVSLNDLRAALDHSFDASKRS